MTWWQAKARWPVIVSVAGLLSEFPSLRWVDINMTEEFHLKFEEHIWSSDEGGEGPGWISGKLEDFPRPLGSVGERHSHKAGRRCVWSGDQKKEKAQVEFQGGRRDSTIFRHLQGDPWLVVWGTQAFPEHIIPHPSLCAGAHKTEHRDRDGRDTANRLRQTDCRESRVPPLRLISCDLPLWKKKATDLKPCSRSLVPKF